METEVQHREEALHTPQCNDDIKPFKGKHFFTLEEAEMYYKQYARSVGFDVRLLTLRKSGDTITWRYIVRSREGEKNVYVDDDNNEAEMPNKLRRRVSMRCHCPAKVVIKRNGLMGYIVHLFSEQHNHPLVEQPDRHFMKLNRKLDQMHQKFILDCAKANIGPTHSYKLLKEILGGHEGVNCTLLEVRNFDRDMKAFVNGTDAQMLLNELARKKEICQAFTYKYELDVDDKLKMLFWSDPVAIRNYHMFGDVVAFDTTYSTNKYCMIFAPFTGMDNHGKPVTFAAGLLSNEDAPSFEWLFKKFVDCMGLAPSLIITDQDLGMKKAIQRMLPETRHRWCMWHIMIKLAEKVSKELHSDDLFKKDLNVYVWSELIEPEVFEEGWNCIMEKYGLVDNEWFRNMFEARNHWVPAYFRDFPKSGLLRTTSISESENCFYKRYTRSRSNLLHFWMNFTHAIDAQRNAAAQLNFLDKTVMPKLESKALFEKHAATVYTAAIFKFVQEEVYSGWNNCSVIAIRNAPNEDQYRVRDEYGEVCNVIHNREDDSFECCCKLFGRKGYLCRHIFLVFKNRRMKHISDRYVIGRWKKFDEITPVHNTESIEPTSFAGVSERQMLHNQIMSSFFKWLHAIDGDSTMLTQFLAGMNDLGECVTRKTSQSIVTDKKKAFEEFYSSTIPDNVKVLPPDIVKTKGSGSRLISPKEMLLKPKRKCAKCKQMAYHDSRNCDRVQEEE